MGRCGRCLRYVAVIPRRPGGLGDVVRAGRSVRLYVVWPPEPAWTSVEYQGFGRPRKPRLRSGQRRTDGRSGPMPSRRRRGVRLRWPREARDHAATCSVPRGCVQPAAVSPAKSTEGHLPPESGRQRTPLLSVQCTGGYPVGDPGIRGEDPVGALIETEFTRRRKATMGLDSSTRPQSTWAGWHHHVCPVPAGRKLSMLLSLQQAWGEKDSPDHEAAGRTGWCGKCCPGNGSDLKSCCGGCSDTRGQ